MIFTEIDVNTFSSSQRMLKIRDTGSGMRLELTDVDEDAPEDSIAWIAVGDEGMYLDVTDVELLADSLKILYDECAEQFQ
jgi:hypothetical protein